MNKRIQELAEQATTYIDPIVNDGVCWDFDKEKFAELIVRECNQAVLNVSCYYKDYRSQIEEAIINNCARAVLEHLGVEE